MKIISLHIARCSDATDEVPVFLSTTHDVSSFSFIERNAVREVCNFLARTIISRVEAGAREAISHDKYLAFVMRWSDCLSVLAVTDKEYPSRVAFQLLSQIRKDFVATIPVQTWKTVSKDNSVDYKPKLKEWLKAYKDPSQFDAIVKTGRKVDETKEILQRDIQEILGNRENIEDLLTKSEDISSQTEGLFKAAKKVNKGCCNIM